MTFSESPVTMKNAATIHSMSTCVGLMAAAVLVACGGGNGSTPNNGASAMTAPRSSDDGSSVALSADRPTDESMLATSTVPASFDELPADSRPEPARLTRAIAIATDMGALSVKRSRADNTAKNSRSTSVGSQPPIVLAAATDPKPSSGSASTGGFVKIADENGAFTVGAGETVRFGVPNGNRWIVKTVSGAANCTREFFGGDPAVGTLKWCEVNTSSGTAPATVVSVAPLSVPARASSLAPSVDLTKIAMPAIGSSTLSVAPSAITTNASGGDFRTTCSMSHMSFDDPIVFPGQSGRAHLHTFFGNTAVNAAATADSIRTSGASTCAGGIANRSSYWVPTLIDTADGTPIRPDSMMVYYKSGLVDGASIRALPPGLRMIAGDPAGKGPGNGGVARFKCVGGPNNQNDKYGTTFGNCDVGAELISEVMFPQCWDGVNLDSPDHMSHMAYPWSPTGNHACPATHPVALPAITFNVHYAVRSKDAPLRWKLSSDTYDKSLPGGYSSHGDWFNGWKSDISEAWAKNCIQGKKDCQANLLGDGRILF